METIFDAKITKKEFAILFKDANDLHMITICQCVEWSLIGNITLQC